MKLKLSCLLLATLILISGCASSLILGKVYNNFGPSAAKRFKSYATFNSAQEQQIDSLTASFQSWHRTTQLNRYADFLRAIVADVDSDGELSAAQASGWWQSVRSFTDDMRVCNPLNVSADFFAGLSDKQVDQIAARQRKNLNQWEAEFRLQTPEQRVKQRVGFMSKWGKRAGVSFNDKQTVLLTETMRSQISLGAQRFQLRRVWMEEFILLLKQRDQVGFKTKITQHINANWRVTENNFPDQWRANEQLWITYIKDYINLQTPKQRSVFVKKLNSTAQTLNKLSRRKLAHEPICYTSQESAR